MVVKNLVSGILVLALFACGTSSKHGESAEKGSIPKIPEIIGASISESMVSSEGDSSEATLVYQFYAVPKFPWQDSVNFAVNEFVSRSIDMEEEPRHQQLSHEFFNDKLKAFVKSYQEFEAESEYASLWFYEGSSSIDTQWRNYVQVEQFCSIFTGGAHPNSFSQSTVISKQDGSTVLLEDLVSNIAEFNRIAEKYFKIARELPADHSIESDETFWFPNKVFECNDNFSISKEGITFTFNAYEIAPYIYGPTEFTVPMKEVKQLLAVQLF